MEDFEHSFPSTEEDFYFIDELVEKTLLDADYERIIQVCMYKETKYHNICFNKSFWINKIKRDIDILYGRDKIKIFMDSCEIP